MEIPNNNFSDRNHDEGGFITGLVMGAVFFVVIVVIYVGFMRPALKSISPDSGDIGGNSSAAGIPIGR